MGMVLPASAEHLGFLNALRKGQVRYISPRGFVRFSMEICVLTPEEAAAEIAIVLDEHAPAAIVFGCEDRGLCNDDLEHCHLLATIPTAGVSSLNLAQAVLLMLYACLRAREKPRSPDPGHLSRRATHAEVEMVYAAVRETLLAVDYIKRFIV